MKKILLYLQSLALVTTPVLTVVACNKTSNSTKNKLNPSSTLSKQEKEIIDNTSLFTRLLLLSRHENLNFNSTDLLNGVFSPKTTSGSSTSFARNYTVDGKTYNLNDYSEKLTTEYSNLSKYNATASDPFLASTLTGMYEDSLYQNYIAKDTVEREDIFGYFDRKNNITFDNITPIVKLAADPNRQQLAWANFTGPLSKYITDNKLFKYQGIEHGGEDPRHFYGRFLDAALRNTHLASEVVLDEAGQPVLKDGNKTWKQINGIKLTEDNTGKKDLEMKEIFGKYQTKLFYNQWTADFAARMLEFVPFVQNFNETATGANYGLKLLNSLFPFTNTKNDMAVTYTLFLLLQISSIWMSKFTKEYLPDTFKCKGDKECIKNENAKKETNKKAIEVNEKAKNLIGGCLTVGLCAMGGVFKELQDVGYDWLGKATTNTNRDDFNVQMVMNAIAIKGKNKDKKIELFKTVKDLRNSTSEWVKEWDIDMKNDFLKFFLKEAQSLKTTVKAVKESIADIMQGVLDTLTSPDDVISLFDTLGDMMSIIADNEDKFIAIGKNSEYQKADFSSLSKEHQLEIANTFGLKDDGTFEENSVLEGLHKVVNNETFVKTFLKKDSPLYEFNSKNVKEIHNDILQYALNDHYWKVDEKSFKLKGAISGVDSINSKFSYSLEYNGVGDIDVVKFLDKPVELPANYNPIEPWHTPTATNVSKDWTLQDHIAYTGRGNGDFKKVNFKYNVEWSNVSDKPEFPYWVITKVDLFRQENGQWKQFYSVM